jgi:ferredoxin
MTKLIINTTECEASEGESILKAARRGKAHIGFICNGNGFCSSCECRVLEGTELLNEANDIEKNWLSPSRRERGYRLGCQATVKDSSGVVKLVTRTEVVRRLVINTITGAPMGDRVNTFKGLVADVSQAVRDHLDMAPTGLSYSAKRLGLPTLLTPWKILGKLVQNVSQPAPKK